jgi:hypothetical protein
MGLTMRQKQAVTKQLALNYQRAGKRKRGEVLDWLVELTGYNRSYAAKVLRQRAKPKVLGRLMDGGVAITLVEDERGEIGDTILIFPCLFSFSPDFVLADPIHSFFKLFHKSLAFQKSGKSGTPYLFFLASFLSPRVLFGKILSTVFSSCFTNLSLSKGLPKGLPVRSCGTVLLYISLIPE